MKLAIVALLLVPVLASARPRIGDPAPALAKLRPGHVTLVDFSATWCGPCHAALAALTSIVARVPDVDLVIVDVGEPAATVARFYETWKLPPNGTLVLDEDTSTAMRWGHDRFPTTFLIDRGGTIRFINRGYGSGYPARIEEHLRALLR